MLNSAGKKEGVIRILEPRDGSVLDRVAPGFFDYPVDPCWTAFLADKRHHLAVAIDDGLVVGSSSRGIGPNAGTAISRLSVRLQ